MYRLSDRRLQLARSLRAAGPVSPPLLYEKELYLREAGELVRYDLDRNEPVWRTSVKGSFRGRPSLLGDHVYAVWYESNGYAHLSSLRRSDGKVVDDIRFAHHGGAVPAADSDVEIFVLADEVFLHLPLPIATEGGSSYFTARIDRRGPRFPSARATSLHGFRVPPVQWSGGPSGEGWIVLDQDAERGARWMAATAEGQHTRSVALASTTNHPELLGATAPAARAGDVLYLDDLGVSAEDFQVLWKSERRPRFRPIPLDEGVLLVQGRDQLVSLRPPVPTSDPAGVEVSRVVARLEQELAEGRAALALSAARAGDGEMARALVARAAAGNASERSLNAARDAIDRLAQGASRRNVRQLRPTLEGNERALEEALHDKLAARARGTANGALQRAFPARVARASPFARRVAPNRPFARAGRLSRGEPLRPAELARLPRHPRGAPGRLRARSFVGASQGRRGTNARGASARVAPRRRRLPQREPVPRRPARATGRRRALPTARRARL